MPTDMREREQGFEAKFVHDEEMRFRARARRDKLFALWAAASLALNPEQTNALMQMVIHIPDGPTHDQALLDAIAERLGGRKAPESLSAVLERCMTEARAALDSVPLGHWGT